MNALFHLICDNFVHFSVRIIRRSGPVTTDNVGGSDPFGVNYWDERGYLME